MELFPLSHTPRRRTTDTHDQGECAVTVREFPDTVKRLLAFQGFFSVGWKKRLLLLCVKRRGFFFARLIGKAGKQRSGDIAVTSRVVFPA
jgi:hypothetical protein